MTDTSAPFGIDAETALAERELQPGEFRLDHDLVVANATLHAAGTIIRIRRPGSGELRGLSLTSLMQMDYATLEKLLPRITMPILHAQAIAALVPSDLMQAGGEVMDFLLPKAAKPDSLT